MKAALEFGGCSLGYRLRSPLHFLHRFLFGGINDPLAYMACCGLILGKFIVRMLVGNGTYKGLLIRLGISVVFETY